MSRLASTVRVALFVTPRSLVRANRGIAVLTALVMGVVYVQLIFVPSLIEGANNQIEKQLRDNVTANIVITPTGTNLTIADPGELVEQAEQTDGVVAVTPTVLAGTQVSTGGRTGSWPIMAVDPDSFDQTFATPRRMREGRWLEPGSSSQIVLGIGIAGADDTNNPAYRASLESVHTGDTVTVAFLGGKTQELEVVGIYETGLSQADQRGFVTTATAEQIVPQLAGQVSAIYLRTDPEGVEGAVIEHLRDERPDVTYEPWTALDAMIRDLTESFDIVGAILGVVSLAVAVIVVFIVTYIDLVNKRRAIGIERAIGISNGAIVLSYVMRAIVFAVVGVVLGAAIFAWVAMPLVDRYPFDFPVGPVTLSLTGETMNRNAFVLVGAAIIGALLPAWRSVKMKLLDAIWG